MFDLSLYTSSVAVLEIFAMGAVGFILVRKAVVDEAGLKLLSFLTINILFPMFIFNLIIRYFDVAQMPFWWTLPLINIALTVIGLVFSSLLIWGKQGIKNEFRAVSSLHNAGYIPLLMAVTLPLGVMAGQVYASVILSIIGFDLCLWSLGVWLMRRSQLPRMDLRNMITPPLVSMVTAIIIVLAGGAYFLSEELLKPVKILGDAAMPLAMLVIGGNLAKTDLGKVVVSDIAAVVLIKLVLMPLAMLAALMAFKPSPVFALVAIIQASMPTSVTLSVIGRHYDTENQAFVNQSIFFTHLISVLTIPLFLALYGKLLN